MEIEVDVFGCWRNRHDYECNLSPPYWSACLKIYPREREVHMGSNEFCSSCGSPLLSTESFCSSCGKKNLGFVEDLICHKCNATISSDEIFCSSCGSKKPNPREAMKIIEAARPNYVKLIFHAIISIIFPIGIGLGLWHIFKNKNFKFGFFLIRRFWSSL